ANFPSFHYIYGIESPTFPKQAPLRNQIPIPSSASLQKNLLHSFFGFNPFFSRTLFFMARVTEGVNYTEEFILNPRGMKLFTCKWLPVTQEPKALIFLCHGYAMESSITMDSTAMRLAKQGFGVYAMDYEGHGKSAGLQGYIENFDFVVDDCSRHFVSICEEKENRGKRRYLMGESMGGAVTLLLHRKLPNFWDGAVLVAPMCKPTT
ncbi:Caffeoylshikimate esterase, partial [Linum grandiflorum]